MEVKLEIPESFFADILGQLEADALIGIEDIGDVHLVGKHNNWGNSPDKAGCIQPRPETKMTRDGDCFQITIDVPAGLLHFKPVVIITGDHGDSFVGAKWIACPTKGVGQFTSVDKKQNWQLVVK